MITDFYNWTATIKPLQLWVKNFIMNFSLFAFIHYVVLAYINHLYHGSACFIVVELALRNNSKMIKWGYVCSFERKTWKINQCFKYETRELELTLL